MINHRNMMSISFPDKTDIAITSNGMKLGISARFVLRMVIILELDDLPREVPLGPCVRLMHLLKVGSHYNLCLQCKDP
jgi:hypothetical protein